MRLGYDKSFELQNFMNICDLEVYFSFDFQLIPMWRFSSATLPYLNNHGENFTEVSFYCQTVSI